MSLMDLETGKLHLPLENLLPELKVPISVIYGRWDRVVLATKVRNKVGEGPNDQGLSRYHIINGVKASLKRLQLDHVDLYQIHGFDPATPIEETVRALDQLVRHGHVRYVGVSNWAAWQIVKALGISANAVKTRLHRARQALKVLLEPVVRGEDRDRSNPQPR